MHTRRDFLKATVGAAALGGTVTNATPGTPAPPRPAGAAAGRRALYFRMLTDDEYRAALAAAGGDDAALDGERRVISRMYGCRPDLVPYYEAMAGLVSAARWLLEAADEFLGLDADRYNELAADEHAMPLARLQEDVAGATWTTRLLGAVLEGECPGPVRKLLRSTGESLS